MERRRARPCPACNAALKRTRIAGVEVDGCKTCGGLWLDEGELQLLGNRPGDLKAAADTFKAIPAIRLQRGSGRCPACSSGLVPFEFPSLQGIRLDRCPGCRGVWLDHGEARAICARLG